MVLLTKASLTLSLMVLFSAFSCSGKQYVVAKLAFPAEGEIVILTDYYYENNEAFYYQVTTKGQTRVPTTYMCSGGKAEKLRFELIPGKQGDIFAVIEHQRPAEVLMLFDSRSGESWPRGLPSDSFEDKRTKGLEMLKRLRNEDSGTTLKLGNSDCG